MVTDINNYFRLMAYVLIAVSCYFSLKHWSCSQWVIRGSLAWSILSAVFLLTNQLFAKPYIIQFLHTANIATLAIFFWIHFLQIEPNGKYTENREKTRRGV